MKKLMLTLFLFSSFLSLIQAAEPEIKWGADQKLSTNYNIIKKVGMDQDGYYVHRTNVAIAFTSSKIFLDRYNRDHKLEATKELVLQNDQKRPCRMLGIFFINGNAVLFMQTDDNSSLGIQLYMQVFDKNLNSVSGLKKIDALKSQNTGGFVGSFTVFASEDRTRIAVCKEYPAGQFNYRLFDESLQVSMEKEFEMPYEAKTSYGIEQFKVDHDGVITMLGSTTVNKKGIKYDLLMFDPVTAKISKTPLSHMHAKIFVMAMVDFIKYVVDNKSNKIYIGGYYCNVVKPSSNEGDPNIEGIYYARIDKQTGNLEAETTIPLSSAFLSGFQKYITKGGGMYGLYLNSLILSDNGNLSIIGEVKFASIINGSLQYSYYDIVAANINMNGNPDWIVRIPKKQSVSVPNCEFRASFSIVSQTDDKVSFLYYDNPKNLLTENDPNEIKGVNLNNHSNVVAVLASVNSQGKIERQPVADNLTKKSIAMDPSWTTILGSGEILVHASDYSHKVTRFGILSVK